MNRFLIALSSTAMLLVAVVAHGQAVDHTAWTEILAKHVHDDGVDYLAIAREEAAKLDAYLDRLARTDPLALERDERLALYLNLYNATMIDAVLDRYTDGYSVSHNNFAIFDLPLVRVGGRTITLNHLENQIIRPEFKEPRIHAALVCAARSCPPRRREAYVGQKLDEQLDDQMRKWLADPKLNQIPKGDGALRLSEIFKWYAEDFGGLEKIAGYINAYHEADTAGRAVEFIPYDWTLNDRPR